MAFKLPARPPTEEVRAGTTIYRVHSTNHGAIFFGPKPGLRPNGRFHASDGSFGVCFLGRSPQAAFVEGFLHGPIRRRLLAEQRLRRSAMTEVHVAAPLTLLPLYGPNLVALGTTAHLTHGPRYKEPRKAALAIHRHAAKLDGILYTSRHDDQTFSIALFDRAAAKIAAGNGRVLSGHDPDILALILRYGLGWTP